MKESASDEKASREFGLEVWGDRACFTRPEMKVERVSYPIITPSAARAIFEAVFWKPAIRWQITRIELLAPIQWENIRRNEVEGLAHPKIPHLYIEEHRQQRNALLLKQVHYRIYAQMEWVPLAERGESAYEFYDNECLAKYQAMFLRRAAKGQCFTQPYLGTREFSASFQLVPLRKNLPTPIREDQDFGLLFYDIDYKKVTHPPLFFHAEMKQGIIKVPHLRSKEVLK